RAVHERDETRRKLESQRAINETLAAQNQTLRADNSRLQADLDKAATTAREYQTAAEEVPGLRRQLAELEESSKQQAHKLAQQDERLGTAEGQKIDDLLHRYERIRLLALAGWGLGALLTLGLIVVFTGRKRGFPDGEAPGNVDTAG